MNIPANSSNAQIMVAVEIKSAGDQRVEKILLMPGQDIMIGRAWENQIIIDDKYIDPQHLAITIDENGSVFIKDLQTKNGTWLGKKVLTAMSLYQSNQRIRLGETHLRIVPVDTVVSPALALDFSHTFKRKFCSISSVLIITALTLFVFFISLYMQETQELKPGNILTAFMGVGVIALLWSLFNSFTGKLFRNEMNFSSHWVLICFTVVAGVTLMLFNDIVSFNAGSGLVSKILQYLTLGGLALVVLYVTLTFSTRMTKLKKVLLSLFITLVLPVYFLIDSFFKEDRELWTGRADSNLVTMSPVFKWAVSNSYEKHEIQVADIFSELDKEVAEVADKK